MGISNPTTVYNKSSRSAIVSQETGVALNWKASPCVRNLLEVISSILVNEYIETVKKNPETFKEDA